MKRIHRLTAHPVPTRTICMRSLHETPAALVWNPDALRANGFFTANFMKTDHNTSTRRKPGSGGGENEGTCGQVATLIAQGRISTASAGDALRPTIGLSRTPDHITCDDNVSLTSGQPIQMPPRAAVSP